MFVGLMMITQVAFADPETITVERGSIVPFSGTLMNREAVAQILSSIEEQKKKCKIEKEKEIELMREDLMSDVESANEEAELCESFADELRIENEEIVKKYNRSISMRPLIAGAGFVGGVGLTILIASALGSAL